MTIPNGLRIFRDVQVCGLWISRWIENAPADDLESTYNHLAAKMAAGKLIQPIDSSCPLGALARLEAPDHSGKILFVP